MFLKELHMAGFKSFAHPMRLELGPGVTAVVGPNGSGKSNIVDAVRWVLGEQSARVLRGAKSEDVIFGGSAARHALGMAEVTLVLDNTDRRVALDVAEVAIARRLYRSGETDYLLNRRRARLRDVLDVAGQAGLGPDSYCVVGQGAIEQLAMQRPQERRTLIADAADIRRHEARLAEIESDLQQTQQNALRVAAVVAEVRPQLERLRIQAERAERHHRVRDEVEALAGTWYGRAIPIAQQRLDGGERHRVALQTQITAARERVATAEQRRADLHEAGVALRAEADALTRALAPARERREGLRVERATVQQRQQSLGIRCDEITADLAQTGDQVAAASTALATSRAALAETPAAQQQASSGEDEATFAEVDARQVAARQRHRAAQGQLDDVRRRLDGTQRDLTQLEAARDATQAAEAARAARRTESQARLAELEQKIARAEQQLIADQQQAEAGRRGLEEARAAHEGLRAALKAAEAESHACVRALDGLLGEERALVNLGAEVSGSPSPPPSPAAAGEGVEPLPHLPHATSLALGSLLSAPLRYQMAIAAALGAAARFRVVDADDAAWSVGVDVNAAHGGVLVPARRKEPSGLAQFRAWVDDALAGTIAYQFAVDVLDPSTDAGLAERYLGSTIITGSLVDARTAAHCLAPRAGSAQFQVATEDGHCLRWNGEHVLGPDVPEAQAIAARVRQEALAEQIAVARAAVAAAGRARTTAQAAENQAVAEARRCEEHWRGVTARLRGQEEALRTLQGEAQRERTRAQAPGGPLFAALPVPASSGAASEPLSARRQALLDELQGAEAALQAGEADLAAAEASAREAMDVRLAAAARQAVAAERLARLQDATERDARELDRLRQRESSLRAEVGRLEAELATICGRESGLARDLTSAEDAMQALEVQHQANVAALARHEAGVDSVIAEQQAVQSELADLRTDEATAGAAVESARGRLDRLQTELGSLAENLAKTPEELLRARSPAAATGLQDLPPDLPPNLPPDLNEESLERRLARALRELRNVGGVDYGVLAEYGSLKDRYGYLTEQLDDLNRAEVEIRDGMADARERMRTQFSTVFEEVNGRFQDMFRGLFGGGDAELLLTGDAGSPQCGVDIVAQPPGKRLHRLATLSGGERSLVGAALLLALIGANPSPFCMLDEVDAALDDANVARFAGTIREMAGRTQFVLVTHNRATMEMADALYGVTMTPGAVSQVLAIRLPTE